MFSAVSDVKEGMAGNDTISAGVDASGVEMLGALASGS